MSTRARMMGGAATLALAAVVMLGPVAAGASGTGRQVVQGQVLAPTGPYAVGSAVLGACDWGGATTSWAARFDLAYRFRVAATTHGKPFVLTAGRPADLDIAFRGTGVSRHFSSLGLGQERGTVPPGAEWASVCLSVGGPTPFTYVAG